MIADEIRERLEKIEKALERLDMGNVIYKELTGHYNRLKDDIINDITKIKKLLDGGDDGDT